MTHLNIKNVESLIQNEGSNKLVVFSNQCMYEVS